MECQFCKKFFNNKGILTRHQNNTKYCLKIQNKNPNKLYKCKYCNKNFTRQDTYNNHTNTHELLEYQQKLEISTKRVSELELLLETKNDLIKDLKEQREEQNKRVENIAVKAISQPRTINNNTTNNTMNNFLETCKPLTDEFLIHEAQYLTTEHFTNYNGVDGYNEFVSDRILANNVRCTDNSRKMMIWSNGKELIRDPKGYKIHKRISTVHEPRVNILLNQIKEITDRRTDMCAEEKGIREREIIKVKFEFTKGVKGESCNFRRKFTNIIADKSISNTLLEITDNEEHEFIIDEN